ncbi:MAG: DUF2804 domain-containing protein [Treponema sp.]|jgi:hypothetical protein|nr:DUF2804 domain-containing protein [Treponema sp.]
MPQTEITEPISALDKAGRPQNFGWARFPFFTYDHNLLNVPRRSISEGDRYILLSPTHMVLFEILDDGYLGYLFLYIISLKDNNYFTQTFMTPFSLGCFDLPGESDSGSIKFRQKKALLNFACMEGGIRIIKLDIPRFSHNHSLRGEVVLSPPDGAESLVTHMPWRGKREAFCCSRRSPWYFAEGVIQFGSSSLVFTRGNGWGIFDWTRGVRPRSDLRFWATGCGQAGDHQMGFNAGFSSADSTAGTENAFFLDGKLHKLDQVSFHIPSGRLVPWRFTSNDNRLEMTFAPKKERDENHKMFFYSLKRRQMFGFFSGKVILDDGSDFVFSNIAGMTERWKSRL